MWKKWIIMGLCMLLLTGCASTTFETLGDVDHQPAVAPAPRETVLQLPQEAALSVWEGEDGRMYLCPAYTIYVQTLEGGDLEQTIRTLSGMPAEKLTVVESRCGDHRRYEWVWTAAGEGGDAVGRCAVLDDGNFHYAVTVMAASGDAGGLTEEWNRLLSSFCLETKA